MESDEDHQARAAQLIEEVRNSPEAKEVEGLGLAIASMIMDKDNALMPAVVQQFQAKLMELIPRSQEELLRAHVFFEQGEEGRSRTIRYALQDELYGLEDHVQHAISDRRKEIVRLHHRQEQALDSLIDMRKDLPTSWKTAAKAVLRDRAGFQGVTNASILSITAERQERSRNLLRLLIAAEKAHR